MTQASPWPYIRHSGPATEQSELRGIWGLCWCQSSVRHSANTVQLVQILKGFKLHDRSLGCFWLGSRCPIPQRLVKYIVSIVSQCQIRACDIPSHDLTYWKCRQIRGSWFVVRVVCRCKAGAARWQRVGGCFMSWARKRRQKLHGHMAQRSSKGAQLLWINVTCFGGLHFMHMTKVSHGIWRFLWLRWMWTPPTSRDGTGSKTLVKLNLVSKQLRQISDWKKDCVTISHNIIFQIMHPNTSNDIDGMCLPPTRDLMAPNFEK